MKACTKCRVELSLDMFAKRPIRNDFSTICRTCIAERQHKRYLETAELRKIKHRAYFADPVNRARINEQIRAKYHRDHELTRQRENEKRRNRSPESKQKAKAYADAYRVQNRNKIQTYYRAYYLESKEMLADTFIKGALAHRSLLLPSQVPQALIDLKRQHLLLLREINEQR